MDVLGDTNRLVELTITRTGFLFAAERTGQLVHRVLFHMNPGDQFGAWILTSADHAGGRTLQIGNLDIIVLLHT